MSGSADGRGPSGPEAVVLRAVEEADLPIFFEHQRDPVAAGMAGFASREREAFEAHWRRLLADGTVVLRTVLYGGSVAGNVVSFLRGSEREVGYWIGREFWGQGIASEALAQFLDVVRERPLTAGVSKGNAASRRVLEKRGFTLVREEGEELTLRLG